MAAFGFYPAHNDGRVDDPPSATDITPMTIAEFSRRSGLSHKALRLYDMSGLLVPAEVAASSGYRFYYADQLERARRISVLRQLDMPLAVVSEVLAGDDDAALSRLDEWWSAQERTMRARRGSYAYLRTRLARVTTVDYPVTVRTTEAAKIASLTRVIDQSSLVDHLMDGERAIREYLDRAGARAHRGHWALYHGFVTPDSEAPVEVAVPYEGTVDPWGDIAIRLEPARMLACATVTRDDTYYPMIMSAYDAVFDWIGRHGHEITGPARELYFTEWSQTAPTDPFVHVAIPIEEQIR